MDNPDTDPPECSHGLPARLYTVYHGQNAGKQFYRCPKPINDSNDKQCKFFEWIETSRGPASSQEQAPPPASSTLPLTPQSIAPNSTSRNRNFEPPTTPTPASQAMKRTFSVRQEDGDDDLVEIVQQSSNSRQKRTRYGETETADGLSPNKASSSAHRFSVTTNANSNWPPKTPPRRTSFNGGLSHSTQTPSLGSAYTSSIIPPSSQETLDGTEPDPPQPELSADLISMMLKQLNNTPDYVRKLERRKIAAEKSRDAKATKIANLEAEVERLRLREKELEAVISAYERGD